MKYLMFYDIAPDGLAKIQAAFPAHRERLQEFKARGVLLMAGPIGNPPTGALGVFTEEAAAKEFAEGDPFVLQGAVAKWRVEPWAEGLSG
jgi:uncharacterized protein